MRTWTASCVLLFWPGLMPGSVISFDIAGSGGRPVSFYVFAPADVSRDGAILLLVPGFNGSGLDMLDAGWRDFAEKNRLVLLAPTFKTSLAELQTGKGYYYPEQWSGAVVEEALRELGRRTGADGKTVLIFGFSAGAHFAHRFALWKPERVKAFVAYSAGWWSDPTEGLAHVPALIMCGENDPRYDATREFFEKAMDLKLPWIWRSYKGTGHEMTPAVRRMVEAFLGFYAKEPRPARQDAKHGSDEEAGFSGDIQTYRFVPEGDAESIPSAVRIRLPSKELAEVWTKEE